ncbi:FAD-dependent oxidoreductase [Cryobacterium sp. Y50]|uniref:FAD-dependent oxidoreductase n=1 Tax=Cryobacterium sp. Y50 TaxID=2048286 RepID=UPI000CE44663|nr:FAD-dependent oxidoreductase [Cryobacterium sp. Y50]
MSTREAAGSPDVASDLDLVPDLDPAPAPEPASNSDLASDVAVIGGGLGGIAAALAAADAGATVILTAQEPMIGGQVTAQLTAPLDEHPLVESAGVTARYRRFRELVRARSGGATNPGEGWVSRLCFEPLVGLDVLEAMLRPHIEAGRIRIVRNARPVAAVDAAGAAAHPRAPIAAVRLRPETGPYLIVRADVFVDATELGDLLPLTGTRWVIGSEGSDAFGEPDAVRGAADPLAEQSCTWAAILVRETHPQPVGAAPPGYAVLRDAQPFSLDLPGTDNDADADTVAHYRFFSIGPTGLPSFWAYRRIRTTGSGAVAGATEAAVINWAGNDYRDSGLIGDPAHAGPAARALTLAFVYWLRTEVPRDPGDGAGPFGTGRGYPELRLAPELSGTPDGLATAPYGRESRRLANAKPITVADLLPAAPSHPAPEIADSLGIAWYHADLHPRVGYPRSVYRETAPFQLPARALVPDAGIAPENLVMGAKNLAATQIAAAAYRVHPAEWAIGEAAGTLAAMSARLQQSPCHIIRDPALVGRVQAELQLNGAPISWRGTKAFPSEPALTQTEIQHV